MVCVRETCMCKRISTKAQDKPNCLHSVGCKPKIAIALGEEFILMRERNANINKQIQTSIYRESTKDLTAYGKVQSLDLLEDQDLKELISKVFKQKESQLLN